ncbi:hypothetical protein EDB85DRAFT_2282327 [Lactarius pseudohatsudake]|nr:hypothetical protein EDB85DRAFT_2282327 [Lactarius pseudohatsudake]
MDEKPDKNPVKWSQADEAMLHQENLKCLMVLRGTDTTAPGVDGDRVTMVSGAASTWSRGEWGRWGTAASTWRWRPCRNSAGGVGWGRGGVRVVVMVQTSTWRWGRVEMAPVEVGSGWQWRRRRRGGGRVETAPVQRGRVEVAVRPGRGGGGVAGSWWWWPCRWGQGVSQPCRCGGVGVEGQRVRVWWC